MKRPASRIAAFLRRYLAEEKGISAAIAAIGMVMMVGFAGFVIDLGHVFYVQRTLQATTDAAALAAAQDICANCTSGVAATTATTYSSAVGNYNADTGISATMVPNYPKLMCFNSIGQACPAAYPYNGIVVKQTATVQMYFAQILGVNSIPLTATATASAKGGPGVSLDVMVVVDTTGSMNGSDNSCSISGATRVVCAMAGVRALLSGLDPSIDQVGLMAFPGLTNNTQAGYDYDCLSSPHPQVAAYNANPVYQVVAMSTNYKTSGATTTLDTSSNIVKAAQGGVNTCKQGLDAVGGVGTYYSDAIAAAQAALVANGRPNTQKVIIFLSDGDASASSGNISAAKLANQCHQAITAAHNAALTGTWIYSIAYGASTSTSSSCSTDSPRISACSTMQQIATDPGKFFSDTTGGSSSCTSAANSISELVSVFSSISQSLQSPRLLPDNTT